MLDRVAGDLMPITMPRPCIVPRVRPLRLRAMTLLRLWRRFLAARASVQAEQRQRALAAPVARREAVREQQAAVSMAWARAVTPTR